MKKTALLAVALAACLGYAPARAADVVSSNIVGYDKLTLSVGPTIIAAQFNNVGGEAKDIQELFDSNTLPGLNSSFQFQTKLQVWAGTGYTTYGWSADGDGTAMGAPSLDGKWLTLSYAVADVDIAPGEAFWVDTAQSGNIVEAGEVVGSETEVVSVSAGATMLANPFPVATDIQSIKPNANLPGLNSSYQFQTKLQVWDGSGYTTYGWSADGDGTAMGAPSLDGKWLTLSYQVATATIPIGQGFWLDTTANGALTFSK